MSNNEILSFIEVNEDNSIDIHFKFGKRFKSYLTASLKDGEETINTTTLEKTIYKTNVKTFKSFFKNELVHDTMMRFVLNTLGVEKQANELASYNALFPKSVVNFMDNFTIGEKYKPYVFIEKTQQDVLFKINENIKNELYPRTNEIFIWLVHEDYSFIKVQLGNTIAKDLKEREATQESIEQLILNEIKAEFDQNVYSKRKIDNATHRGLGDAMARLWGLEKIASSELYKEVFKTNPALLLALEVANFTVTTIENYKFKEVNWNPKLDNYLPFIKGNPIYNAQVCGFINGIIDEVKAIPEMFTFFTKIFSSEKEKNEFLDGLKKLLDEGILQAILEGATKEYKKALQEGNVTRLYYNLAHDSIQIVSLLIGVFQLAKGVASFINFTKKGLQYIKRYGRKGIDDLDGLSKKQLTEIFENDRDVKTYKTGTGGFIKYKRIISRDVFKQEELNSCAAACIRQLAKENGKDLTEKLVRDLARTTNEGTFADGIKDAMIEIFGKDKIESGIFIDPDFNDVRAIKEISIDDKPWIAWIRPNTSTRPHAILIDRVIGNDIYIKDPWPLKGIDKSSVKYLDNGNLDHSSVKWFENNGVEAVANLDEFADQWAFGGNLVFKIK